MNIVFVRYGHSVRKKNIIQKNPNAKNAVKAEISVKKLFDDSAKRSAFFAG